MKITKQMEQQAISDVLAIRQAIQGEALLLGKNYNPRLIAYVCITTAIVMAHQAKISPSQFKRLVADTIDLYSKGGDKALPLGLSDPNGE